MENAVQALKTAAAVLIFVIAITVSFTMFSKAKVTADAVIKIQDKQKYLESAEVDNGILYTSSTAIQSQNEQGESNINGMTIDGYRIVGLEDVISTLYRYSVEKYGVTIVQQDGTIISRFDSNTENIVRQYYSVDKNVLKKYEDKLSSNLTVTINKGKSSQLKIVPKVNLENIYKLQVDGNSSIKCGAPWYGNNKEIAKRTNSQLCGKIYELNGQKFNINKDNLENKLSGKKIIEVVDNIDTSSYLKDEDSNKDTNLLTEYQMPTLEIIYIIQ